jgi:hypothetical protein
MVVGTEWPEDEWIGVVSSHLTRVRWSKTKATKGVLSIEFKGVVVHHYYEVPRRVWQKLMGAPSHGGFFHDHVRDAYRSTVTTEGEK